MENYSNSSNSGFYNNADLEELEVDGDISESGSQDISLSRKGDFKAIKHRDYLEPVDFDQKQYSMQNDLLLGWRPKIGIKNPFPLSYNDKLTEILDTQNPIYRGFRPSHSYSLHRYYSKASDEHKVWPTDLKENIEIQNLERDEERFQKYSFSEKNFGLYCKQEIRDLFQMDKPQDLPSSQYGTCSNGVQFDSFFESGNCDLVFEKSLFQYDVYLRVDSNTQGHTHWFYFRVRRSKRAQIRILIKNMSKSTSIFQKFGAPYFSSDNRNWKQLSSARYYPTPNYFGEKVPSNYRKLHTLEFDVNLEADQWIYLAYCPPYTFSKLCNFLKKFDYKNGSKTLKSQIGIQDNNPNIDYTKSVSVSNFCLTESLLPNPKMIITNFGDESGYFLLSHKDQNGRIPKPIIDRRQRPIIVLVSRVHPGETCGSHMMHGALEFLTGLDPIAVLLRELFEFHVVPMMNIDGVILGNFRTGLSGDDLNRSYLEPTPKLHPSVSCLINMISRLNETRKVVMFLDFHGHSTKPNVFSYGPELDKNDPTFNLTKLFTKLVDIESIPFKFKKSTWKVNKKKKATARAVFLKSHSKLKISSPNYNILYLQPRLEIKFCYTIEASVGSFKNQDGDHLPFSIKSYQEVGKSIITGIYRLFQSSHTLPEYKDYFYPNLDLNLEHVAHCYNIKTQDPLYNYQNLNKMVEQDEIGLEVVEEGGSDSESSADDLPVKKKKKMIDMLKKMLKKMLKPRKEKKKISRKKTKKKKIRNKKKSKTKKLTNSIAVSLLSSNDDKKIIKAQKEVGGSETKINPNSQIRKLRHFKYGNYSSAKEKLFTSFMEKNKLINPKESKNSKKSISKISYPIDITRTQPDPNFELALINSGKTAARSLRARRRFTSKTIDKRGQKYKISHGAYKSKAQYSASSRVRDPNKKLSLKLGPNTDLKGYREIRTVIDPSKFNKRLIKGDDFLFSNQQKTISRFNESDGRNSLKQMNPPVYNSNIQDINRIKRISQILRKRQRQGILGRKGIFPEQNLLNTNIKVSSIHKNISESQSYDQRSTPLKSGSLNPHHQSDINLKRTGNLIYPNQKRPLKGLKEQIKYRSRNSQRMLSLGHTKNLTQDQFPLSLRYRRQNTR